MNDSWNGWTLICLGDLVKTSPTILVGEPVNARAAALGYQPTSSAISRIRVRVRSEIPGLPLRANETALGETPARRAMSDIVRRVVTLLPSGAILVRAPTSDRRRS